MATRSVQRRERLYVDGEWIEGDGEIEVTDLADDGSFARVAAASPEQATAAIAAADHATDAMAETTIVQRAEWLDAIADGIEDRTEEFAEVIVREAGKPIGSARGEVRAASERFRRAVEEIRTLKGEYREGTTQGHEGWEAIVRPEPMGVALCISPYNYPLSTTALQVAPALAAGNSVIVKPASQTPVSAAILAEIVAELDLPDGAFNFVSGQSREIGAVLSGDERIDAISMTGSSSGGERVARETGITELHLELGGNAPAIVFADADLDAVAGDCARGGLKYAGQRCSAVSRVLAHESVHDELVERFDAELDDWQPGDLFEEETSLGPLIDEDQAEWVETLIEDAADRGATLVRGGERDGRFVEPTLLADVPHGARVLREEQFGPIVPITTFRDADEAVRIANDTPLALDAAVFTSDYDRALSTADRVEAGAVRINGAPSHGIGDIPFGGNDASGIGREGLGVAIEDMLTTKTVIL